MRLNKILVIVALLLVPIGASFAASLLQQKDHGGAVWQRSSDGTTIPAGDTGLVTEITDLSAAVTKYILAPKTGNIARVYTVLSAALTVSDAVFTIMSNNADIVTSGIPFTNTGHTVTIAQSGSAVADVDSSTLSPITSTKITQGDVIAIVSAGGSGGAAGGVQVVIFIE